MEHEDAGPATQESPAPPDATPDATGLLAGVGRRWARVQATGEAGMSTAEYAVGTVAACAFAAVLYKVVTGGSIVTALTKLIDSALSTLS